MKTPPLPANEEARLATLYSYRLLNTLPEQDYDNLTRLASSICNMPISLITLLDKDRQWFKSAHGLDVTETSRAYAFCAHAILNPNDIMIVPDAHKDERFTNNPLVVEAPNVIFYAGIPLVTPDGHPLGSLCVIDNKPNNLTEEQVAALKMLANQAMRLIELHKANNELLQSREHLQQVNKELKKFAQIIARDLHKPCETINDLADIIVDKYAAQMDVDGQQILALLKYSCSTVKGTIKDTLKRAQLAQLQQEEKVLFSFNELISDLKEMLPTSFKHLVQYKPDNTNLYTFKKMVLQTLMCFVNNSISYNDNAEKSVQVNYEEKEHQYEFVVKDNGLGLPVIQRNGRFEIFDATNKAEYQEYFNNLNYAKQLVHTLNGKIEVAFEEGKGSEFMFSVGR